MPWNRRIESIVVAQDLNFLLLTSVFNAKTYRSLCFYLMPGQPGARMTRVVQFFMEGLQGALLQALYDLILPEQLSA